VKTCKVCTSKDRAQIEEDLLNRISYRTISHKFGVSHNAVGRHKRGGHIEVRVAEAVKQTNLADGAGYWQKLELLSTKCEEFLNQVEQNKIEGTRSQYVRELRETYKLILQIMHAKREQELEEESPFKIITSAPWQALMRILKDIYPDVEKKVLEVLQREHKAAELPDQLAEDYGQGSVEDVLKGEFEFRDRAEREDMEIVDLPDVRLAVARQHKPKGAGLGSGKKIELQENAIEPHNNAEVMQENAVSDALSAIESNQEPASQEPASIKSKEGPVPHDQADELDQEKEHPPDAAPTDQADESWEDLIFRDDDDEQSAK